MALTNATTLADYGAGIGTQGATLKVDATNKRVGVGTDSPAGPEGSLQVGTGITFFGNTGIVSAIGGKFSGDFTVGGVLTFEDVTNIDAVGIITAQSHVSIADSILHTGDTDTSIRFPSAGTFTVETNGSERVRVTDDGAIVTGIATVISTTAADSSNAYNFVIRGNDSGTDDESAQIFLGAINATTRGTAIAAQRKSSSNNHDLIFKTSAAGAVPTERLRLDSSGRLLLGTTTEGAANADNLTIADSGHAGMTIRSGTSSKGAVFFSDATSGSGEYEGVVEYNHSDNNMLFFTSGSEAFRVDSSQRVLIGTASNVGSSSVLQVREDGFGRNFEIFRSYDGANTPARIRFSNSRGTAASPTIVADDDDLGEIRFNGHDGTNYDTPAAAIFGVVDGTPGENDMPGRLEFHTTADGGSSTTERLRIDRDGLITQGGRTASDHGSPNLLIWGSDPTVHLSSTGSTNNSSFTGIKFAVAGGSTGDYSKAGIFVQRQTSYNDLDMIFAFRSTNDAAGVAISDEKLRIDSDGRLLMGSDTAQTIPTASKLQVTGNDFPTSSIRMTRFESGTSGPSLIFAHSRGTESSQTTLNSGDEYGKIRFYGHDGTDFGNFAAEIKTEVDGTPGTDDTPGRIVFSTAADGSNSVTERARLDKAGTFNVFGSDVTPIQARCSTGAGTVQHTFIGRHSATSTTNGTISLKIFTNGNIQNTNDSYGQLSDAKLKENIVDAGSQWDDFKAVRFRKYNFKEETGHETHTQIGVIAQELETVCPGLVYETPDVDDEGNDLGTTTKAVKSSILTKKALVALQEAMNRIETLEAQVAALQG